MTTKKGQLTAAILRKAMEEKINAKTEIDKESKVSQAHELETNVSFTTGVMGPDIPEPKEYDPY